jgi:class 3 adenylate cyclase/tetratricopeptide (TPR) repeat protein
MVRSPDDARPTREAGRRCHVALLFSDLCEYTALSEISDPEDVASMLQAAKSTAMTVIEKHGGTLNQFYGDGFLAVFGLPIPGEDDARRATEAALELHETIRELRFEFELPPGFRVRLHSGIHSGLVFARDSDPRHGRYELIGDPVNTTARLCSAAGMDEILASEVTLRGVAPFFETESVEPLRLKGKGEPVPVYRVLGRSRITTRFEARAHRGLTPFVGRAYELERLSAAFDHVTRDDQAGRLVHVIGDAGVGKTRFLEEFRRRLPSEALAYVGCCESYGNVPPLLPFLQVLRQVFGLAPDAKKLDALAAIHSRLGTLDETLRRHLPALLHALSLEPLVVAPNAPADAVQSAISSAICALLFALAAEQPLLVVLDDWQWADDASHQVLADLLSSLAASPARVLVVAGARSLAAADPLSHAGLLLELHPFDAAEVAAAVHALLPNVVELAVKDVIQERSGGNPLFLEELCQAWPDAAGGVEASASRRVPNTLHGLIQARVERLPLRLLDVARAAAVAGSEFEQWLLEEVHGGDDLSVVLQELAQSHVIYAGSMSGVYRFNHGITREVVYDSVKLGERRRLHAAIAAAIEARFGADGAAAHCEALAYHFAGAAEPERAAAYAEIAGDKAAATSSLDRARQQYRTALTELDRLPSSLTQRRRWLGVSRKWAAACVFSPSLEITEVLNRALGYAEELEDLDASARAHYWLGWLHYALGAQTLARSHTEHALELAARSKNTKLTAQLLANLGQIHVSAAECAEALRCLDRALDLKREQATSPRRQPSVPVGFAYAMACKAIVHGYLGDFDAAASCVDAAFDAAGNTGHAIDASLFGLSGMVLLWQGRWQDCMEASKRTRATAERVSGPYVFAMSQTLAGYARWMLNREPSAIEELKHAVDWLEARRIGLFLSLNHAYVAEALSMSGDTAGARQYALRAIERSAHSDRLGDVVAYRALARVSLLEDDDSARAEEYLARARTTAEVRGSRREVALVDLSLAELLASGSRRDTARILAEEARQSFDAMRMAWYCDRATGLLTDLAR